MNSLELQQLGWQPYFQQQLSLEEWELYTPARVVNQQRSVLMVLTETSSYTIAITPNMPALTVGDWCLLDQEHHFVRLLDRLSLFSRKAAGTKVDRQLIAANIDTALIVCSLNQDFNLNRIERYLALSSEAQVEPVIVLTKADLCESTQNYIEQVQSLDSMLAVIAVNALSDDAKQQLSPWCKTGKTLALLGSSGVGKSTLVNTLSGEATQQTGGIREDDSKGRHTTSGRSLHLLPNGGLLLDTPGMRQLQLADCEEGLENVFADITELAQHCKFGDCQHQDEPGCAVITALERGSLDERRLANFRKLMREQAFNSATLAEKRERDRKLGKMYRQAQVAHNTKRKG